MIDRPHYLAQLRRWKDRDLIKVVTGVRRCGKSTLLRLFATELEKEGVPPNRIITINLEQLENERLIDYRALHDEVLSRAQPNAMNYVFIDEVQNAPDFQKAVDSLYTRPNIDLYLTGSNALLLGGTLATLLSGRYVVDAKSIMGLFSLDLSQPVKVEVHGSAAERAAFEQSVAAFEVKPEQ